MGGGGVSEEGVLGVSEGVSEGVLLGGGGGGVSGLVSYQSYLSRYVNNVLYVK